MQDIEHAAVYTRAVRALGATGLINGRLIAHWGRQGQVKYQLELTGDLEVLVLGLEAIAAAARQSNRKKE